MPTLTWIGKDKVVNHHHDVPYFVLEKTQTFRTGQDRTGQDRTGIVPQIASFTVTIYWF
jgi:adenine-specific DNA-methyltransferase